MTQNSGSVRSEFEKATAIFGNSKTYISCQEWADFGCQWAFERCARAAEEPLIIDKVNFARFYDMNEEIGKKLRQLGESLK